MSTAMIYHPPSRYTIDQSVGQGGKNLERDVIAVQTMLKEADRWAGERDLDPGEVDGKCTPKTIRSIRSFQARFMTRPDGLIEPGRGTIEKLRFVTFHDPNGICPLRDATARELIKVLKARTGDRYVLGAVVPKDHQNWIGPWDCAEFVAWGIAQISGEIVGCRDGTAPNGRTYKNSYTGWFGQDLPAVGTEITEDEAAELPGAILLRLKVGESIGHIAVSIGGDRTIEAAGSRLGVTSLRVKGRTWNSFWKLNFLRYDRNINPFP